MLQSNTVPGAPMFSAKSLRRLIGPLIVEQLLAVLVGMADVVMVSAVGEAAVSGVSLVDMINVLMINIFAALATGGAVVTSQLLGARQESRACASASQLLAASLLLGIGVGAVCILLRGPMLRLLFGSIAQDVMDACLLYLVISAVSYPFLALYNAGAALFRSMGNARVTMRISMAMNVINIAGNALCIYGLGMGVAGVAIPSLVSRAFAAVVIALLLRRQSLPVHLPRGGRFRFDGALIKSILHVGIPSALENSFFQLGRVLVVSIISAFGTVQIAANAVANNFDSLGVLCAQAINLAAVTVIGQCVGAQDYTAASHYMKKLVGLAYLITAGVNVVLLSTLPFTLQLYNLSAETLALASTLIWIHDGCAILLWPTAFTLPSALRGAADVRYTMWVSIGSMWVFRILGSYVLGQYLGMGAIGVWIAMVVDWVCRATLFLVRFCSGKWKNHRLLNKNE